MGYALMMKTEITILEIIRSEVLRGKVSGYRIYKGTGINQTALYRIVRGWISQPGRRISCCHISDIGS